MRVSNRCKNLGRRQTEIVTENGNKNESDAENMEEYFRPEIENWWKEKLRDTQSTFFKQTMTKIMRNEKIHTTADDRQHSLKTDNRHTDSIERIVHMCFSQPEIITGQLWTLSDCKQDVELREFGLRLKRYDSQIPQIPTGLKWSHLESSSSSFPYITHVRQSCLRRT